MPIAYCEKREQEIIEHCKSGGSQTALAKKWGCAAGDVDYFIRMHMRDFKWAEAKGNKSYSRGTVRFSPQQLEVLKGKIVKPEFERKLTPLLHFKGQSGLKALGVQHRYWNFTQGMMLQGFTGLTEALRDLHRNPQYSHLCGPSALEISKQGIIGFFNRLLLSKTVHCEDPDLIDYVDSLDFWRFEFERVPVEYSGYGRRAFWRKNTNHRHKGNVKPSTKFIEYPFLIHDAGKSEHELLKIVNKVVPRSIDPDLRADVCQDILVGILEGLISRDSIEPHVKSVLAAARKANKSRYQDISLDQFVYDGGRETIGDRFTDEDALWSN